MALYNSFQYSEDFYGDGSIKTVENLLWAIQVDWDGDGVFDGSNEAGRVVDVRIERGRDNYLNRTGNGFERYAAGTATIFLDNDDGRYNPFNASSPLYQQILPGRFARIGVRDVASDTYHELIRGKIEDIQPFQSGNRALVKIDVVDGQRWLEGRNIKLSYKINNSPPDEAGGSSYIRTYGWWADRILSTEGANWPDDEWPRTYNALTDYLGWGTPGYTEDFYGWLEYGWFWDKDALQAMRELEEAELGTFLHARNGQARFLSSHFTYDNLVEIYEDEVLRDITTPQPWEIVRNEVTVDLNQINTIESALHENWQIGGTNNAAIFVEDGSSVALEARFSSATYNASSVVPKLLALSFVINAYANADGSGTDLSSGFYATFKGGLGNFGDGATVLVFNNSGSGGYLTNLQVKGGFYYTPQTTAISDEDATSQGIYGSRVLKIDTPWVQHIDYAQTITAFLLSKLKDPQPLPVIKIQTRPDIQFALDLYVDAVNFISGKLGIDRVYRIGKIMHEWLDETGQHVLTTLKLEPYFAIDAPYIVRADLLNTFATSAEANCSGPAAEGKMEWCTNSQWSYQGTGGYTAGHVQVFLGDATTRTLNTTGLSYLISTGAVLHYFYKYLLTGGDPANSHAVYLELSTTESGVILTKWAPFIATASATLWSDDLIDLSEWAGEHLSEIKFVRDGSFVSAGANGAFLMSDISLGNLLGGGP